MKRRLIITLLCLLSFMSTAFAAPNNESSYLPNDIYTVLFSSLGQDKFSQPISNLQFWETRSNKIESVMKNEFPIPASRVARGVIENYRYTQPYYDNFWMVYLVGKGGEWDDRLFRVSFSLTIKEPQIKEKTTDAFVKLTQMYGDYTAVTKYKMAILKKESDLNYYIWGKNNMIITYRCVSRDKESIIVVEMWDKKYFIQYDINGKYNVSRN